MGLGSRTGDQRCLTPTPTTHSSKPFSMTKENGFLYMNGNHHPHSRVRSSSGRIGPHTEKMGNGILQNHRLPKSSAEAARPASRAQSRIGCESEMRKGHDDATMFKPQTPGAILNRTNWCNSPLIFGGMASSQIGRDIVDNDHRSVYEGSVHNGQTEIPRAKLDFTLPPSKSGQNNLRAIDTNNVNRNGNAQQNKTQTRQISPMPGRASSVLGLHPPNQNRQSQSFNIVDQLPVPAFLSTTSRISDHQKDRFSLIQPQESTTSTTFLLPLDVTTLKFSNGFAEQALEECKTPEDNANNTNSKSSSVNAAQQKYEKSLSETGDIRDRSIEVLSTLQVATGIAMFALGIARLLLMSVWGIGIELVYAAFSILTGTLGIIGMRRQHSCCLIASFVMSNLSCVLAILPFISGLLVTVPETFSIANPVYFTWKKEPYAVDLALSATCLVQAILAAAIAAFGCQLCGKALTQSCETATRLEAQQQQSATTEDVTVNMEP